MDNRKHTVIKTNKDGGERTITGTIEELANYFSYTLAAGNSWNQNIKKSEFRSIEQLIRHINLAFDILEKNCYGKSSVRIFKEEKKDE